MKMFFKIAGLIFLIMTFFIVEIATVPWALEFGAYQSKLAREYFRNR